MPLRCPYVPRRRSKCSGGLRRHRIVVDVGRRTGVGSHEFKRDMDATEGKDARIYHTFPNRDIGEDLRVLSAMMRRESARTPEVLL